MLEWPPPENDEPEVEFHRVASTSQIVAGSPLIVRVGLKRIALFLICSPASILIQAIYLLRSEPRKITILVIQPGKLLLERPLCHRQ